MVCCGLWGVYQLLSAPFFLLMNATNRAKAHAALAIGAALLNLPVSVWLAFQLGLPGPVLGSLAATFLVTALPGIVVTRRLFREPMFLAGATQSPARPAARG
jgi:hypothetical protein